jgi:hypothetical protein
MIRSRLVPPPFVQLAAVVAVLCVGPLRAADPVDTRVEDSKRSVELLSKIEQRLAAQQAQTELAMEIIRKDLTDLRNDVSRLQKELADVRRAGPPNTSSYYQGQPPPTGPTISAAVPPPAQLGQVRLVNTYFTDMTATVNGVTYIVPPNTTREFAVPAGPLNYQIYQVPQAIKSTSIASNEMVTLTLFPR